MTMPGLNPKKYFLVICFISLFFSLSTIPVHSQVYSDDQLFDIGNSHYHQQDFLNAAVFLFAYIQRSPQVMTTDTDFANMVQNAYQYSLNEVIDQAKALIPEQSGKKQSGLKLLPPKLEKPKPKLYMISETLVIRGGGQLYFDYTPYSNFFKQPQIWITFERGQFHLGKNWENKQHLNIGQATFLNREIAPHEPNRLIIPLAKDEFSISWTSNGVMGISSVLAYLSSLLDPNQYMEFSVYNDGKGNFIAHKPK